MKRKFGIFASYTIFESLEQTLEQTLKTFKKNNTPLNLIKSVWDQSVDWIKNLEPHSIKNETLFIYCKTSDALILQFKENEIISFLKNSLGPETFNSFKISKIKILKK